MATITFDLSGSGHVEIPLRQFDADEYIAMAEAGVFEQRPRAELIGGYVVDMAPSGSDHNSVVMQVIEVFAPLMTQFKFSVQGTLKVDRQNVFDPDFMLLHRRAEGFRRSLPTPGEVELLIEVSSSSLGRDAGVKLPIYAKHGITDFWIVDVDRETLIVHRKPSSNTYGDVSEYSGDATVSPLAAPEFRVTVHDLFT
jgi:Uma2 family endonuclease